MNLFRDSSLSDFTRGGQTTLHFFRMIGQVIGKLFKWLLICLIALSVGLFYAFTEPYERYVAGKYTVAWMQVNVMKKEDSPVEFEAKNGKLVKTNAGIVYRDKFVNKVMDVNQMALAKSLAIAFFGTFLVLVGSLKFVFRAGSSLRTESYLRGSSVVESDILKKLLKKKRQASHIKIAGTPIVKGSETSNILLTGSPGTGKSVVIRDLVKQIRAQGDRAIIYSSAGEFIEQFYREDKDVILNPLDKRCPAWNIWAECKTPPDYDSLTASLIPMPNGNSDPFWTLAPRMLFSSVAMKLAASGDASNKSLLDTLSYMDLDQVAAVVQGTVGATLLAEGAEKTALSVRASLAPYIQPLKYLKESDNCFSIKDWVRKTEGDDCIFISSRSDQKETLKPLISMWLDIATSAIMSLEADQKRRIWLIIDELPSLNKLPALSDFLPQGRKYGGCGVISFQSFAQLVSIYTLKGAESVTGMCDTWVSYRLNEPATADWLSKSLGTSEFNEANEGISYGANEIRDGANLSISRKARTLVLPSELMNLPNLHGYLRVQGEYPIAKFVSKYTPYEKVAKGYVEAEYDASLWGAAFKNTSTTGVSEASDETKIPTKAARTEPQKVVKKEDKPLEQDDLFAQL